LSRIFNGKHGGGLVDKPINKIPFQANIPGCNFCGPVTKVQKRSEPDDQGINSLDEACKEHDIAYSQNKALSERHRADSILIDKAWSRVKAPDSSLGEKAAAYFVTNIMKAKKKFGMGLNKTEKKGRKKIKTNKMRKTNLSTVINVATKTIKNQKPLYIMTAIKGARKSIYQSIGSWNNV